MRRSIVCQLSLAIAAVVSATGILTVATPARAQDEFQKERQLYMMMRIDLENAQEMLRYYEKAWTNSKANGLRWMDWYTHTLESNGCNTPRPWNPESCEKIENKYLSVRRQIAVERGALSIAITAQREEVERRQRDFQTAVANYVAQVALQAAMLPPQPQVRNPPPGRRPPAVVRRRPPTERPPKTDWSREMRGLGDRLQRIQPLTGR